MARPKARADTREPGTAELRRNLYQHGASEKGRRTRALLLAAARSVFERDGYVDARVADIVAAAGVAHGTFYTYFESKMDIFRSLTNEVNEEMMKAVSVPVAPPDSTPDDWDFPSRLDLSNRRFLDVYRKNAALMKLAEQQASVDPEVGRGRVAARRAHVERITASLRRLQREGLARQDLDCRTAAAALAAMISNFAYYWYSLGEPFDEESARGTLTQLWLGAIGYQPPKSS